MKNESLNYLHLFNNPIDEDGAYFLITALLKFN